MATSTIFGVVIFIILTCVTIICSISATYYNRIRLADGALNGNNEVIVPTKTAQTMLAFNLIVAILAGIVVLMMMYSGVMYMYNKVCIGGPPMPGKNLFGGMPGMQMPGVPGMSGMPGSPMMMPPPMPMNGSADQAAF